MDDKLRDQELLRTAAAGDLKACRTLVDENLKPMLGLAYNLLENLTEAEDIAQEAFLRLWKQAPKWKPEARVRVWLYRVVQNLCIDYLRKHKRFSDREIPENPVKETQVRFLHNGQVSKALNAALMDLPPRQRVAITLVHLHEERNTEAAEIMDISVEALESLLARGRRKLRKILKHKKDHLIGGI